MRALLLALVAAACSSTTPSQPACGAGTVAIGGTCQIASSDAGPDGSQDATTTSSDAASEAGCALAKLYPDKDGDGYGSALEAATDQCVGAKGYAGNNLDCGDGDDRAHPGQTAFFDTPIVGPTSGKVYDFNCDGKESQKFTDIQPCQGAGVPHTPGWQSVAPACGATGSFNKSECEKTPTVQSCN